MTGAGDTNIMLGGKLSCPNLCIRRQGMSSAFLLNDKRKSVYLSVAMFRRLGLNSQMSILLAILAYKRYEV